MPSRGGFSKRIEQTQTSDPLNLLNRKTDNQHAKQRRIEQNTIHWSSKPHQHVHHPKW